MSQIDVNHTLVEEFGRLGRGGHLSDSWAHSSPTSLQAIKEVLVHEETALASLLHPCLVLSLWLVVDTTHNRVNAVVLGHFELILRLE